MNLPIHSELEPIMKAAGKLAGLSGSKTIEMKHVLVAMASHIPGPGAGFTKNMLAGCPDCDELEDFAGRIKRAARVRRSSSPKKPGRRLSDDAQERFERASKTAWLSGHKEVTISHLMLEILNDATLRRLLIEAGAIGPNLDLILLEIKRTMACSVEPSGTYHVRRLSEEQVNKLAQSGISFTELSDATGPFVRVTGEDLLLVCELLECYILTTYGREGNFGRWNEAVIRSRNLENPALTDVEVQAKTNFCDGLDSLRSAVFERLLRETILPVVRRPVYMGMSCSVYPGWNQPERFAIWLDSTQKETALIPAPTHILGVDHNYLVNVRAPAEVDRPYIDRTTGHYFAELVGGTDLFLHQGFKARSGWGAPIPEKMGPCLALFSAVLDECATRLSREPELDRSEVEKILSEVTAATPHDGLSEWREYPIISDLGFIPRRRCDLLLGLIKEVFMRGMNRRVNVTSLVRGREQAQLLNVLEDPWSYTILLNARRLEERPVDWHWPISDEQGNVLADVSEDCLRIYSDPIKHGSMAEAKHLAEILLLARRYLGSDRKTRADMMRERYAQTCLKQLTTARSEQAQETLTLAGADAQLRAATETAKQKESELLFASLDHEFSREFDSLVDLEKIRELTVTLEELVIETDTIFCTNPQTGLVHELGRFKIQIDLNGRTVPHFLNQTRTVKTHVQRQHAPHVGENGLPCLGSIRDLLPGLVQRRQFVMVVQLCLAFLESVNPDDSWGKQIVDFPVAGAVE